MANKQIKKKHNIPINNYGHYLAFGDMLFNNNGQGKNINNLSSLGSGILKGAATAVGQMGGNAISGGLESGAGNVLQGLSGIASAIPGPWGAVASAGLGLLGGITNRLFGSKLNNENIAKVKDNINSLNSFQSNASDYDSLSQNWKNATVGMNFDNSFIGKDGVFSNKAEDLANKLRIQVKSGEDRVLNTLNNNADNISTTQIQNLLANYAAFGGPLFANGGRIHINPKNRGKFNATKKRTGKTTEELTHSKNPLTRKRAIFAQNAAKWKHALGGDLSGINVTPQDAEFTNGVTDINNGGMHEENPIGGVPMGIAPDGLPNLVEEGEVKYNNYIFSNRLKANRGLLENVNLPKSYSGKSFAEIAKGLEKESKERPNDPISKKGLEDSMAKLQAAQEEIRTNNNMNNTIGRTYANGGKPKTKKPYQDWKFMEPLLTPKAAIDALNKYNRDEIDNWYGTTKKNLPKRVDPNSFMKAPREYIGGVEDSDPYLTWLRYAPVVGATIGLGQNLFSKPDYSTADALLEASNQVGTYTPVGYTPIGNYLQYTPFDRDYYTNKLNAQAGATRRAIMNSASPARNAALLAADYNAQNQLGSLARQAEEYNLAQRQNVEAFNRATNMTNSELGLKAAMANQDALMRARSGRLSGMAQALSMRDNIDARKAANLSANLTNVFNSLGDIGNEEVAKSWINESPGLYYNIFTNGNGVTYKGPLGISKSRGGYLTINSRRRRK